MPRALPSWCCIRSGHCDVLLIAPHGGRRPSTDAAFPRVRKVNDLYTAELTLDLAAKLDATAIVNGGCDRNEIDLNRIGQITRRAPWFLDLLVERIAALRAHHREIQVLVVHGWNIGQPKCDLGVGGTEIAGTLHPLGEASLSVAPGYWAGRVAAFRAACAGAGITTVVGERYPAAHRSNLLQALSPRFVDHADPRLRQLAEWARGGHLNAVQLELGIPLRWPGRLREALVGAAAAAFGSAADSAPPWRPGKSPGHAPLTPLGFHFHDAGENLTLFTSIGRLGVTTGGRLLLFLGGQEIALFTGEEAGERSRVGGLELLADGDGARLHFRGHVTRLSDAGLYLDLEAALAASALTEIELRLHFEPSSGRGREAAPRPGRFTGTIGIGNRLATIAANGFLDPALLVRGPGRHEARTHLAASFDENTCLSIRCAGGETANALVVTNGVGSTTRARIEVETDADAYTPRAFLLRLGDDPTPVRAWPLARMPIVRPLDDGTHARITFGPARFERAGRIGWGVYEYGRRIGP